MDGKAEGSLQPQPAAGFSVDLIRFIAIILIITVHCSGFPYKIPGATITGTDVLNWFTTNVYAAFAMVGVPLFVMLTGALLLNPNKADEPLKVFYKKRLDRIALPFVFWTIIYFAYSFTVLGKSLTPFNVMQGLLMGSYFHLWYLYLLMGLYSVTPVLRVLVKHLDRKLFTYLLILWFAGTVLTPFIQVFTEFSFDPVVFIFFNWVGYFLLGIYLVNATIRRRTAYIGVVFGLLGAILGDWLITAVKGEYYGQTLHNYMSVTAIIGSAALFFLLTTVKTNRVESHRKINCVIHWVSKNTLSIYLIHMIVLLTLTSSSIFGIYLNTLTHLPLIDVPIFVALVFGVSTAMVYLLKKIPYVNKLIG